MSELYHISPEILQAESLSKETSKSAVHQFRGQKPHIPQAALRHVTFLSPIIVKKSKINNAIYIVFELLKW